MIFRLVKRQREEWGLEVRERILATGVMKKRGAAMKGAATLITIMS